MAGFRSADVPAEQHENHGVGTAARCECGWGYRRTISGFAGLEAAAGGSGCTGEASPGELYGIDRVGDCQCATGEEEGGVGLG